METKKPRELLGQGSLTLIYGPTGAGKTVLAGSITEVCPTLFVSTELGGPKALIDFDYEPDVIEARTIEEVKKVIDYLYSEAHDYQAIVIDTLTEFQLVLSEEVLQAAIERAKQGKRLIPHNPDQLELRDWQPILVKIWRLIRYLQTFSKERHIIVTCQVCDYPDPLDPEKDADKRRIIHGPFLRGQWRHIIGAYFDVVGFLSATVNALGKVERKLYVQPYGNFYVKTRRDSLGPVIEDPTMAKILEGFNK